MIVAYPEGIKMMIAMYELLWGTETGSQVFLHGTRSNRM
jgi:hypothetical protein